MDGFDWSPDGAWLAYRADQLADEVMELFTVAPEGGPTTLVSGGGLASDVLAFDWSADGTRLVYRAGQLVDDQVELFVAAPDGGAVNAAISGPITAGGDVVRFARRW